MPSILISGPDGTGKSSLAGRIAHGIDGPMSIEHYWPLRPPRGGGVAPSWEPPRGLAASVAKLLVVWALNLLAYWIARIRGRTRIIERGWWDQVVDPGRYRLPSPAVRAAVALGRFIPRADVAILLVGDAHLIRQRKDELTLAQIEAHIAGWREVLPLAAKRSIEIDVSAPLDQVVAAARAAVGE